MQAIGACPPGSVGLPLLEVVNTPFRGFRSIAAGAAAGRTTFFDRAVGAADVAASDTASLQERETSFLKASSFATPTQNTLYSFNIRYNSDASFADLADCYRRLYWEFKLGPKFYGLVPLLYIPSGSTLKANVSASPENVVSGVESPTLAFDMTVPEQGVDETGACVDLPTRIPMFIPSEQLLQGIITQTGVSVTAVAIRWEPVGNSFLRREV